MEEERDKISQSVCTPHLKCAAAFPRTKDVPAPKGAPISTPQKMEGLTQTVHLKTEQHSGK